LPKAGSCMKNLLRLKNSPTRHSRRNSLPSRASIARGTSGAGWVSAALLIGAAAAFAEGAPALTYVFVCPDKNEYVVRATGAEAWVFRPGGALRLRAAARSVGSA
jgi:hypothetical protein